MRRISWTDQRISGGEAFGVVVRRFFLGASYRWRGAGCGHHSEGEHDERDVAMPSMPGAGLVMIEAQFILGRLETILDRPAMSLDCDQGFEARSKRTPGAEKRQVTISDVAADQQAPRP